MFGRLTAHFTDRPAIRRLIEVHEQLMVGRDPGCDVHFDDDRISRRHARLAVLPGRRDGEHAWYITDLGSKNGTSVNGQPVLPGRSGRASLPQRCWLDLGGVPVRFESLTPEEARTERRRDEERWRTTLALQRRLAAGRGLKDLLGQVLSSVRQVSGAARAFVLLEPPGRSDWSGGDECDPSRLELAAVSGLEERDLVDHAFAGSVGAVERCLASGRPVVSANAAADAFLGGRPSVTDQRIRALVCLPLDALGRRIGAVYADSTETTGAEVVFTELDLEILEALTSHAALAVAVARLDQEARGLAAELPTRSAARRPPRAAPAAGARGRDGRPALTWGALLAAHARDDPPAELSTPTVPPGPSR